MPEPVPVSLLQIPILNSDRMQEHNRSRLRDPQRQPPRSYVWNPVDCIGIRVLVGLLILAGVECYRRFPLRKMWSRNPLWRRPGFTATFSRDRFFWIMALMRFDDAAQPHRDQRNPQIVLPKLAAVSQFFDPFVQNLSVLYLPGFHITVDEMLPRFKGRCLFRVYMSKKPSKLGIKVWACADARKRYVCNMQIYSGMVNNQREINQVCDKF